MKKTRAKLALNLHTVRLLDPVQLQQIVGGFEASRVSSCVARLCSYAGDCSVIVK